MQSGARMGTALHAPHACLTFSLVVKQQLLVASKTVVAVRRGGDSPTMGPQVRAGYTQSDSAIEKTFCSYKFVSRVVEACSSTTLTRSVVRVRVQACGTIVIVISRSRQLSVFATLSGGKGKVVCEKLLGYVATQASTKAEH